MPSFIYSWFFAPLMYILEIYYQHFRRHQQTFRDDAWLILRLHIIPTCLGFFFCNFGTSFTGTPHHQPPASIGTPLTGRNVVGVDDPWLPWSCKMFGTRIGDCTWIIFNPSVAFNDSNTWYLLVCQIRCCCESWWTNQDSEKNLVSKGAWSCRVYEIESVCLFCCSVQQKRSWQSLPSPNSSRLEEADFSAGSDDSLLREP